MNMIRIYMVDFDMLNEIILIIVIYLSIGIDHQNKTGIRQACRQHRLVGRAAL